MYREHPADVSHPAGTRDRIAEANHRIANSLSLVASLARRQVRTLSREQSDTLTRDEVGAMLGEFIARVEAVGRLHRILSDTGSDAPVDLGGYLQHVAGEVVSTTAKRGAVVLKFDCQPDCRVPPDRALQIGLIVIELVTNSVKHAHPAGISGHVEIHCRRDSHATVVTVSDDGVGLPEGFDSNDSGHSGIRLMHSLARQIGATIAYDSGSLGLRCEIVAPAATAVEGG